MDSVAEKVLTQYKHYINPSLARLMKLMGCGTVEWRARGVVIQNAQNEEFIDCLGGYGVFAAGHCHRKIIEAVKDQLDQMPLSSKVLLNKPLADLSERLAQITPGKLQYSFISNSGTEAVEGALKLARLATGKTEVVSATNSFHGKTFGALSASGREMFKTPFKPLVPGFKQVPFGDEEAVESQITDQTAAVILEPIQGEGGINVPPEDYFSLVRKICSRKDVLLIIDEIQTGFGRTGEMFAVEHYDVAPDILISAKALGGGVMPIGAFIGTPEVWESFISRPLIHTSTFGGNPLACRAALAFLEVLQEENLVERARSLGEHLMADLKELRKNYPDVIADVRGKGLLVGIEFAKEGLSGVVISEMIRRRVLVAFTLNNPKVMRLEPPLTITRNQIGTVVSVLNESVKKAREYVEKV